MFGKVIKAGIAGLAIDAQVKAAELTSATLPAPEAAVIEQTTTQAQSTPKANQTATAQPTTTEQLYSDIKDAKFGDKASLNPDKINAAYNNVIGINIRAGSFKDGIQTLLDTHTKGKTSEQALEVIERIEQAFGRDAGYDIDAARDTLRITEPAKIAHIQTITVADYKKHQDDPTGVADRYFELMRKELDVDGIINRNIKSRFISQNIKTLMRTGLAELGQEIDQIGEFGAQLNRRVDELLAQKLPKK